MAETTIEWTATPLPGGGAAPGYSFNPWVGCAKVSPGCDRCYAEGWAKRTGRPGLWRGERRRTSAENWRKPLAWDRKAAAAGVRAKVFCASLADVFDNRAEPEWRAALWGLVAATPSLDWLLLTKRPQNIGRMLPAGWGGGWPNVWLGTTCENQEEADRRIPRLLLAPARVRFLSCEPLLGPLDLRRLALGDGVHWVIAGGESGGGARPMEEAWAADLRDQCRAASVPFFMKQMARRAPIPPALRVRQWPAAAA